MRKAAIMCVVAVLMASAGAVNAQDGDQQQRYALLTARGASGLQADF